MVQKKYYYGLGRRKCSTATVRLYAGKGDIVINNKPIYDYFVGNKSLIAQVTDPIAIIGKQKQYDITVIVNGGGITGQVDAIKLAISKAILQIHSDLRLTLKRANLLKRDPREKERKKYGLRSARKREQFSKR